MNIFNIEDIEEHMVFEGILDPIHEEIAISAATEGIQLYISEWKEYKQNIKDISLSAFMVHKRLTSRVLPCWRSDTLWNIHKELAEQFPQLPILFKSIPQLRSSLSQISVQMNQNSHVFLLLRNILTKDNMYLLSSKEYKFPYGSSKEECISIQAELLQQLK